MSEGKDSANLTTPTWLWALLPALLAAALAVPALGRDIFDVDEAATLIGACARHFGPCTPAEAVRESARWPDNAWGQAIVFSQWGRLVGWSEFAIRAFPWLIGPLTIAWAYRLGRDLFSHGIALSAAILLATSVIFLTYMHNARFYGPAMLFATITLWGYWHVALADKLPGRGARAVLLLGATGLLYSQYFAALLLTTLGLFHLLFVRKGRRWWQPLVLFSLATLLALPQFPDLLGGIALNQTKPDLHSRALHAPGVLSLFLRYVSSDLLNLRQTAASLLLPGLPLLLAGAYRASRRRQAPSGAVWFLAFSSVVVLLLIAAANELFRVLEPSRARYLAILWPSSTLLISVALLHPGFSLLRPSIGRLIVLAIAVLGVLDFTRQGPLVRDFRSWADNYATIGVMNRVVRDLGENTARSLLVIDYRLLLKNRLTEAYTSAHPGDRRWLVPESTSPDLLLRARGSDELMLLLRSNMEEDLHLQEHVDHFLKNHWIKQHSWSEGGVTLIRFVTPFSTLLIDRDELVYERDIRMAGSGILQEEDSLRFLAHLSSVDAHLLSSYSLAVHIIDRDSGERVAQGDVGVGPGTYVRKQSEIDTSELPAGDYEVHVALYDWRTGERLPARDVETGAIDDMHVLHHFRIE